MKVLAVDREKIKSNLECVRKAAGGAELIAVLKANAYGLGLREIAGLLREEGVRRFAVTEPSDALRLRDWGFADEEILVLRSSACEDDIRDIIKACATASIGSYDAAVALNGMAEKDQVQRMVKTLLALPELPQNDAADALAMAICHAHSQSRISASDPI